MVEETAEYHLRFFSDRGRSLELSPILRSPVVAVGLSTERPKASIPGRLFYEKDTGTPQVDDGSAWNVFGGGATELAGLSDVGTVSYTAGQVLRADGTDFDSDVLHHTDLDTVSPDDHHVKTTSSDIDHALITNVLSGQHHAKTGDDEVHGLLHASLAANKPAAGIADRFWLETDTGNLSYDDGTAWTTVANISHDALTGVSAGDHHVKTTSSDIDHALITNVLSGQHHTKFAEADIASLNQTQMEATEPPAQLSAYPLLHGTDTDTPATSHHTLPKTVNQGTVTLGDTETFTIWRATLPAGKAIKIIEAGIQPSGVASLVIEVQNITDAVSIYSNNVSYDDGSYSAPLSSGGAGDDVEIRLRNDTGATDDASGWVTFVVE